MKVEGVIAVAAILLLAGQAMAQGNRSAAPDWITATNQPCKIWNPEPQPNESVTWSGECKDGYASGQGVLKWTENGKPDAEYDGGYANGKRNGRGVLITPDGQRVEGVWVNDRLLTGDRDAI
jgi:hypothetical protein